MAIARIVLGGVRLGSVGVFMAIAYAISLPVS
jgi:hypothetical protein